MALPCRFLRTETYFKNRTTIVPSTRKSMATIDDCEIVLELESVGELGEVESNHVYDTLRANGNHVGQINTSLTDNAFFNSLQPLVE